MKTLVVAALLFALPGWWTSPGWAQPDPLDPRELAATTGGFLDFYMIMPTIVVKQNSLAQSMDDGNVAASQHNDIEMHTDVSLNLGPVVHTSAGAPRPLPILIPSAGAQAARAQELVQSFQQPVWVPWKQELRPLWYFGSEVLSGIQR